MMQRLALGCALLTLACASMFAQETVPAGTLLPVQLETTVDAHHAKAGQEITSRIMQDVPLGNGKTIKAGAKLRGHIVEVNRANSCGKTRVVLIFDRLKTSAGDLPIRTSLRAIGSLMEVFDAQLPTNAFADRGTSTSDWVTVQIGGAAVYRGNGKVIDGADVVGKATEGGDVTAKPLPSKSAGCRGPSPGMPDQAFWLFSPAACGVYGFRDLQIANAGRDHPAGQIILESSGKLRIPSGSGFLLRVVGATQSATLP